MLIPQYQVLVLKLSPIYTVSLNTVFSIPQNQCYPGTPCTILCFDSIRYNPILPHPDYMTLAHNKHVSLFTFTLVM